MVKWSILPLSKALYNSCLSFTHMRPIHAPTAIGCHARYQPARQEQLGVRRLRSGTLRHARVGSNRQPSDCQTTALTSWATSPHSICDDSHPSPGSPVLAFPRFMSQWAPTGAPSQLDCTLKRAHLSVIIQSIWLCAVIGSLQGKVRNLWWPIHVWKWLLLLPDTHVSSCFTLSQLEPDESWRCRPGICRSHQGRKNQLMG